MSSIQAAVAITVLTAFLSGIPIGVILIASLASRREDHFHSLTEAPPGAVCHGARQLVGAHTLHSGFQPHLLNQGPGAEKGCGHHGPHGMGPKW